MIISFVLIVLRLLLETVAWVANRQYHATLLYLDVPFLAMALTVGVPVPSMPSFCPSSASIQNTFKSSTYDTELIMHRRKYGIKDPTTFHKLSKWHDYSTERWKQSVYKSADILGLQNGTSIYEIGVGVGAWLRPLTTKYADLELGGSDLASSAAGVANEVLGPHFCYADAFDLSYAPIEHYDFVASQAVFYIAAANMEESAKLVKQAVRLLKPGTGRLFVGYNSDPSCVKWNCVKDCGCGDGRVNLPKKWWKENSIELGLKDIKVMESALNEGSQDKYDIFATKI